MVVPVVGFGYCKGIGCSNLVKHYKNSALTKWCSSLCRDRDYRMRCPKAYQHTQPRKRIKGKLERGTYKRIDKGEI